MDLTIRFKNLPPEFLTEIMASIMASDEHLDFINHVFPNQPIRIPPMTHHGNEIVFDADELIDTPLEDFFVKVLGNACGLYCGLSTIESISPGLIKSFKRES